MDLETTNKVMDSIMDDTALNFTATELSTAVKVQLQKVINQICQLDPNLLMGVTCLYVFLMTQAKSKNVELPAIGISNDNNRDYFMNLKPEALKLASMIFDTLIVKKLNQ